MTRSDRAIAIAAIVTALTVTACSHEEPKAASAPPTVTAPTTVVRLSSLSATRALAGTVRSSNVSPLSAKAMGNVLRVHVAEGDRVQAGQLLVEIDAREARAQSAAASSAIVAAEANASLADATFRRFSALLERHSVSPQEFDDVRAKRDAARAEVSRMRAMATQANVFVGNSEVRAPMNGIVTARFVDPGAQAAPGMPLLTIEDANAFRIEATAPEDLNVRAGDPVTIDTGVQQIEARVTRVQPNVDASSRGSLVQIDLARGGVLRSGSYVRVLVATGQRDALTVPPTAIVQRGQLTSVFVVGPDGLAHMRLVRLGDGGEVLSGLDAGERIVVDAAKVRDGVKVS